MGFWRWYFSGLKNPVHEWTVSSNYTVESRIEDRGGAMSDQVVWNISVNDTSDPVIGLTVQGVDIKEGLSLRTNERSYLMLDQEKIMFR